MYFQSMNGGRGLKVTAGREKDHSHYSDTHTLMINYFEQKKDPPKCRFLVKFPQEQGTWQLRDLVVSLKMQTI